MSGINGIGGIPEPRGDRPSDVRDRRPAESVSAGGDSSDGVVISSEAQAAAVISDIINTASAESDIRTERVEAARQAIENGDFQNPDVARTIAERVIKFL